MFRKGNTFAKGNKPNKTSFKKGLIPWNKGLKYHTGNIVSSETRKKIGIANSKPKVKVECICGKIREFWPAVIKSGKGKFCSKVCYSKSLEGKSSWNKGLKGYFAGKAHWNWRGGVTPINLIIRNSTEMKEWKKEVFKRDDYTCQMCRKRGVEIQADHIKPFVLFPELRFDLDNGRTLCVPCHRSTATWGVNAKKIIIQ